MSTTKTDEEADARVAAKFEADRRETVDMLRKCIFFEDDATEVDALCEVLALRIARGDDEDDSRRLYLLGRALELLPHYLRHYVERCETEREQQG